MALSSAFVAALCPLAGEAQEANPRRAPIGILVVEARPGSPSAVAGLEKYDCILRVGGAELFSESAFLFLAGLPGSCLVEARRADERIVVKVEKGSGGWGLKHRVVDRSSPAFPADLLSYFLQEADPLWRRRLCGVFRDDLGPGWMNSVLALSEQAAGHGDARTGLVLASLIAEIAGWLGDGERGAWAAFSEGRIQFYYRAEVELSERAYSRALVEFRSMKNSLGEACCLEGLGDTALKRSDHETARKRYEEALPLYREAGSLRGQANVAKSLGDLSLRRGDHSTAQARYREALPVYRAAGDLGGEAGCILGLGQIAFERSDHDEARERYEEALPLYRKAGIVLGEANCVLSLGEIALEHGDGESARALFERALVLYKKIGNLQGEANCVHSLGRADFRRSDHQAARDRFDEAMRLYRRSGDLRGQANCLHGLGDIAQVRSEQGIARALYEEALTLYRRIGDFKGEANCLCGLGEIAHEMSDIETALAYYERALPLYRRVGDIRGEANCVFFFGQTALERNDYETARRRFDEAFPLYQSFGDLQGQANTVFGSGDSAFRRADYVVALARFEEAMRLYRKSGNVFGEGNCVFGIGQIALNRGDFDLARDRFDQALALYAKLDYAIGRANCLQCLGDVALGLGDVATARARHEEALAFYRQTGNALGEANSLHVLGGIALGSRDHRQASDLFERALVLYRKAGNALGEANSLMSLGHISLLAGRSEETKELYARAIGLYEAIGSVQSLIFAHLAKTYNDVALADLPSAVDSLSRAVDRALEVRSRSGTASDKLQFAESQGRSLKGTMLLLADLEPSHSLSLWERFRGRSFLEGMSGRSALEISGVSGAERTEWSVKSEELARARTVFAAAAQRGGAGAAERLAPLREALGAAERELDAYEEGLAARYPRYGELKLPEIPNLVEASKALEPGEIALVYLVAESEAGCFTVTADGAVRYAKMAEDPRETAALVSSYRESMERRYAQLDPAADPEAEWARLAPHLVPPAGSVPAGTEGIVIIPDGILAMVPWENLPHGSGLYGEAFKLSYAPSLSVLYTLRSKERDYGSTRRLPLMAFGGAYYGVEGEQGSPAKGPSPEPVPSAAIGNSGLIERTEALVAIAARGFREKGWEDLPGAKAEVGEIARRYYAIESRAEAASFTGIMASEAAIRLLDRGEDGAEGIRRLADARILHFACHGESVADFPETSRLVLTQAEAVPAAERSAYERLISGLVAAGMGGSDGSLLAAEIVGLNLKADLVVLSACETAEGKVTATEGVVGLLQSWMVAGANGVVASLWPVDDEGTRLFMTLFHAKVAGGESPKDALRDTQGLLRSSRWRESPWRELVPWAWDDYSSPYYWAAFQYWGK